MTDDTNTTSSTSTGEKLKSAGPWGVRYAYLYLTLLITAPIAAAGYAAYRGWISPEVSVSVNASLGWVVEYAVAAFVALFLFWTFVQVVRVTGFGFIKKTTRFATDLMDGYSKDDLDDLTTTSDDADGGTDGDG